MQNPYTISFGREPGQMIPRPVQKTEIVENFSEEQPSIQTYMITGVRGSGKTVLLTDIANELSKDDGWIVAELNPERDMLKELAATLASRDALAQIFKSAKINLSFFGMGLEISGVPPITDVEVALQRMLEALKKKGRRVLIEVDEVTNTQTVRELVSAFQIFIRKDLPVFLLMTGLYENVYELQNAKTLTFLYRAPKIALGPLNIGAIASNYASVFHKDREEAMKMAALTDGYSFAFQTLGYLTWEADGDYESVIDKYKQYLEDYVYEKIWSELSPTDRKVACGIAGSENGKISAIREKLDMTTNQFNPYRIRLIRKGIVDGTQRGILRFVLPLFKDFVQEQAMLEV